MNKSLSRISAIALTLMLSAPAAMASTGGGGGGLPWDGPLTLLESNLTGVVAHVFIIISIVATGLLWAFGDHGSSMRKVAGIAAGGSMALGAASLVSGLGLGSGATIGGTGNQYLSVLAAATIAISIVTLYVVARHVGVSKNIDDQAV